MFRKREPHNLTYFCRELRLNKLAGETDRRRREIFEEYPLMNTDSDFKPRDNAIRQEPWFKKVFESVEESIEANAAMSRIFTYVQVWSAKRENYIIIDEVLRKDLNLSDENFERFIRGELVVEAENFVGNMRLIYAYCSHDDSGIEIGVKVEDEKAWLWISW